MKGFNKWKWAFIIAINWIYRCHISKSEIIPNIDLIWIWVLKINYYITTKIVRKCSSSKDSNNLQSRFWIQCKYGLQTWANDWNSRLMIFADTNSDKHLSFEMSASEQTEINSITKGTRCRINSCLQKYSIVVLVTVESNFAFRIFKNQISYRSLGRLRFKLFYSTGTACNEIFIKHEIMISCFKNGTWMTWWWR